MSHRILKKISSVILTLALFVGAVFYPATQAEAAAPPSLNAGWPSFDAYLVKDPGLGYIIEILTKDQIKTSKIYYETFGISLTRCISRGNLHMPGQYATFIKDKWGTLSTTQSGKYETNIFYITLADVMSSSNVTADWRQEIQDAIDGKGCVTLKLDCMMVVRGDPAKIGPYVNIPGMFGGSGLEETGISASGLHIKDAEGWRNPNGLKTHFNKYLTLGPTILGEEEGEAIEDEYIADDYTVARDANGRRISSTEAPVNLDSRNTEKDYVDASYPWFATRNDCDEAASTEAFDIGDGIPSGEYLKNQFKSDIWFGRGKTFAKTKKAFPKQDGRITFLWEEYAGTETDKDGAGNEVKREKYDSESEEHTFTIPDGYASYEYMLDIFIYELIGADVENVAYSGGSIGYSFPGGVTLVVKDSGKLTGPDIPELDIQIRLGRFGGSKGQPMSSLAEKKSKKVIKAKVQEILEHIGNTTITNNDYFRVDTREYLKEDIATGIDFFGQVLIDGKDSGITGGGSFVVHTDKTAPDPDNPHKDCTMSSAFLFDYRDDHLNMKVSSNRETLPLHKENMRENPRWTFTDEENEIQIPETTDNGYYSTDIDAYFQEKHPTANGSMRSFFAQCMGSNGPGFRPSIVREKDRKEIPGDAACLNPGTEAFYVHTPIVSPASIRTSKEGDVPNNRNTQLIMTTQTDAVWDKDIFEKGTELRLDETYYIHWDIDEILNGGGEISHPEHSAYGHADPSVDHSDSDWYNWFDRYVQDKYVKFPFEVVYNGCYYHLRDDGTTGWIRLLRPEHASDPEWTGVKETVDDHWVNMPFYIPSCGGEKTGKIEYRVHAYNAEGNLMDHLSDEGEEAFNRYFGSLPAAEDPSEAGTHYVANFSIPVQTSGWIYGFAITGSDNADYLNGDFSKGMMHILPFCTTKSEKRAGTKNRIGGSAVRWLLDGWITNDWPEIDTVPLSNGKSKSFSDMGAVWKGQNVTFTVKTIGDLYHDSDKLIITPTYRYVTPDGHEVSEENTKVYYHNENGGGLYMEAGSNEDWATENRVEMRIGTESAYGSWYDREMADIDCNKDEGGDWWPWWPYSPAQDGAQLESDENEHHYGAWNAFSAWMKNGGNWDPTGEDTQTILNKTTKGFSMSRIELTSGLRLFSGEYEELRWNLEGKGRQNSHLVTYKNLKHVTESSRTVDGINGEMIAADTLFGTKKDTIKFRRTMQTWYGQYYVPMDLFIVNCEEHPDFTNLYDYMEKKYEETGVGIKEDDEIFAQGGYLIVNFDIKSVEDGELHLQYNGGTDGMQGDYPGNEWNTEGYDRNPAGDDVADEIGGYDFGDVLVIDLSLSVRDKYKPGIFNIN